MTRPAVVRWFADAARSPRGARLGHFVRGVGNGYFVGAAGLYVVRLLPLSGYWVTPGLTLRLLLPLLMGVAAGFTWRPLRPRDGTSAVGCALIAALFTATCLRSRGHGFGPDAVAVTLAFGVCFLTLLGCWLARPRERAGRMGM